MATAIRITGGTVIKQRTNTRIITIVAAATGNTTVITVIRNTTIPAVSKGIAIMTFIQATGIMTTIMTAITEETTLRRATTAKGPHEVLTTTPITTTKVIHRTAIRSAMETITAAHAAGDGTTTIGTTPGVALQTKPTLTRP